MNKVNEPADAGQVEGDAGDFYAALDVLVPLARLANSFDGHVDGDNGQTPIKVGLLRAARRVIGSPPGADPQKTVDAIRAAPPPRHDPATDAGWRDIASAPKDGRHVLLWVCSRGSIRRGVADICWWGKHDDWGEIWLRHNGREVVGKGVALLWRPLPAPPEPVFPKPADAFSNGDAQ